jgi:hypothetical protein
MTVPERFQDALEGTHVACLVCKGPMVIDRKAYEHTVREISRWQRAWPGRPVPLLLVRLMMRCLHAGHLEVWHAAPPVIAVADPAPAGETVEVECGCGRLFRTARQEEHCGYCRGHLKRHPRMQVADA